MAKFRKKPVVIEATVWHKNGDHPNDYDYDKKEFVGNDPRTLTGEELRANDREGQVVRYYRGPKGEGENCNCCQRVMSVHGWISTLEGWHIVCPGDFIITGVAGERYPCKDSIFKQTYEEVCDA